MKQCTVCRELKDEQEFDRCRNSKYELVPTPRCKECRRAYVRQYNRTKASKTGMSRDEWLNAVRKPRLSPEERQELGKKKWKKWYDKNAESMKQERLAEADQVRAELEQRGKKVCGNCGEEKLLSGFIKKKRTRKDGSFYYGYNSMCKLCKNRSCKTYKKDNPDVIKSYRAQAHVKAARSERSRIRDIRKSSNAVPNWLTPEMKKQIRDIYMHMRDCRAVTGEEYHVDHIVPLKGENICGLHVPWNLQVLPADVNMSKSNSFDEDTPYGPHE